MRKVEKISPTSLHLWESDREQFYLRYMAEARPERDPQSGAMAVGSAFDGFVKCALYQHIFGNDGDGEYDLKRLVNHQVQNDEIREWAWEAGKYAFDCYRTWGCYDELLEELLKSEEDPRFEFELLGMIGDVPTTGKPDLWYKRNVQVVYDWKVNNYCSLNPSSPKKLYKTCRDCWGLAQGKATRGFKFDESKAHPKYAEMDHFGHKIGSHWLHEVDKTWADQLCIYSWLLGVEVGDENTIVGLDQLACKQSKEDSRKPLIRVAQHRCRVSKDWQDKLYSRLQSAWKTIQSGHIFDDVSREDSDACCEILDMTQPGGDDAFWTAVSQRQYRG
jgi:hypothetical protein